MRRSLLARAAACLSAAFLTVAPARAGAPERIAESYVTNESDTLVDLAVKFDMGYIELLAANPGTDPWLPGAGREIVVPNTHLLPPGPREGVIVNLGDLRLYYFPGKGKPVQSYPIGIGREGVDVPLGRFKISAKREKPTWVPPPSVRADKPELPEAVPPGPDNPLGDYALNLGNTLYRIHGTNLPYGVGRRVSYGCIRMYPEDIEALFRQVSLGTPVTIVNEPVKAAWIEGELYLDVHPEGAQLEQLEEELRFEPWLPERLEEVVVGTAGEEIERVVWWRALNVATERSGVPTRITGASAELAPLLPSASTIRRGQPPGSDHLAERPAVEPPLPSAVDASPGRLRTPASEPSPPGRGLW